MLKFPRKEGGGNEKEMEGRGKELKKGGVEEEKEREKGKWTEWDGEGRRKCVKRNEGAWLATRKKNIFGPWRQLPKFYLAFIPNHIKIRMQTFFDNP